MKNFKFYKNACVALALATGLTLTGCGESVYISDQTEIYDTIDSNAGENVTIDPQVLDVNGEDFKLVVNYSIGELSDFKWRVTSDKDLFIEAYTSGLPDGYKVWIDNVHIDTFIVSTKKQFNGILQDTMDDRIHNSLLMGFPISDTTKYSSINLIEGQNDDFIEGTFYGNQSYQTGEIKQKRYTDEDYLKRGVYANKIGLVFGLLVQGPNDLEPYGVDVKSTILVTVYNKIETIDGSRIRVYEYDRDGNSKLVDEYQQEQKQLTR